MSEENSQDKAKLDAVQDWAKENPLKALAATALTTLILSLSTNPLINKAFAQKEIVNGITKAEADGLYISLQEGNRRTEERKSDYKEIKEIMVTKPIFEERSKTNDAKLNAIIEQQKIIQDELQQQRQLLLQVLQSPHK